MKRSLRVTFRRQCSRRSAHVSQRRGVGLLILKRRREPRSTVRFVLLLNLAFKNCPSEFGGRELGEVSGAFV